MKRRSSFVAEQPEPAALEVVQLLVLVCVPGLRQGRLWPGVRVTMTSAGCRLRSHHRVTGGSMKWCWPGLHSREMAMLLVSFVLPTVSATPQEPAQRDVRQTGTVDGSLHELQVQLRALTSTVQGLRDEVIRSRVEGVVLRRELEETREQLA